MRRGDPQTHPQSADCADRLMVLFTGYRLVLMGIYGNAVCWRTRRGRHWATRISDVIGTISPNRYFDGRPGHTVAKGILCLGVYRVAVLGDLRSLHLSRMADVSVHWGHRIQSLRFK